MKNSVEIGKTSSFPDTCHRVSSLDLRGECSFSRSFGKSSEIVLGLLDALSRLIFVIIAPNVSK